MINLISIEIEGFGSVIKPIKYKLNLPGLNRIEGANGAGKTTITNALAWVGWGKLVKPNRSSVIPWPHVIDENYHGTRVSLKFSDGEALYKIIRCNEYKPKILGKSGKNRLIILKNNAEYTEGLRDKKDYQKWIINKIGYSFDLFKSTVLFTQELDNLMKEDGPSKKRIFDEAFETVFVNVAKEKVEQRLISTQKALEIHQKDLELASAFIKGIRENIKTTKESIKNFEEVRNKRLQELITKKKEYEEKLHRLNGELISSIPTFDEIKRLEEKKSNNDNHVAREFRLMLDISNITGQIETLKRERQVFKDAWSKPQTKCDKCGRDLNKEGIIEFKKKLAEKTAAWAGMIVELEDKLEPLKMEHAKVKLRVEKDKKLKSKINKLHTEVRALDIIQTLINNETNNIKDKESEIEKLKAEQPLSNKLPELRSKLGDLKLALKTFRESMRGIKKDINIDQWLIKDPLSNSGLKAFIFDSMLGKVNNYLSQYKQIIGFGIRVFVDMDSANKDIRILIERGGDEVPYEDLSKGQKQLTHVALAFSLSDTVQSIKPINCIFLDELFESLNAENTEKVGNIVIKKAVNKCVHLITHNNSFSPANCHTTYVELNAKHQTHLT